MDHDELYKKIDDVHQDVRELRHDVKTHLDRLSAAEVSIEWLRGHLKISTGLLLSIVSGIIIWWFTKGGIS